MSQAAPKTPDTVQAVQEPAGKPPRGASSAKKGQDDRALQEILLPALLSAGDFAYVWDLTDDTIRWFGGLHYMLGTSRMSEIDSGEAYNARINVEDLSRRLQSLSRHLQTGDFFDCEYRLRKENGDFVWVHDKGRAELDEDEIPTRLSGILRVVNTRKHNESVLEHKANFDELTGHLNRMRLREALQSAFDYNTRYQVQGGYMAIGIDKLSMVNDGYGPQTADAVIVAVGNVIERCLRVTDQIGRLGGDRFGVVLSQCDETGIKIAAEKILETLRSAPIDTPSGPIHVTVSIGGVAFPGLIRTAQEAMTAAESALNTAKGNGRNCYVIYKLSEKQRRDRRDNMMTGEKVMRALEQNRICLAYQPVVYSDTREISYYETLLRMIEPDGSVVAAGQFIPVAEKLGMMRLLDQRALELAVDDLKRFPDITLAINISGLTVTDQSWLRNLVSLVSGRPELASRLIVEITETAALEDFEVSARFVNAVRDLGCKVALDDFGSGYTSFRHMKTLTVDVVKIDGAFIKDVAHKQDNHLFVRTLLGLADGFGLQTVAECVETEEEARILLEEGADFLQGWLFGKPDINPEWRADENDQPAA